VGVKVATAGNTAESGADLSVVTLFVFPPGPPSTQPQTAKSQEVLDASEITEKEKFHPDCLRETAREYWRHAKRLLK
jgi:hypothetical protein